LASGGRLILALPNARSPVFDAFGPHWRGLEAPRHLALPTQAWLVQWLAERGWRAEAASVKRAYTWAESAAFAQRSPSAPKALDVADITELVITRS
jgi:hypothetical protein